MAARRIWSDEMAYERVKDQLYFVPLDLDRPRVHEIMAWFKTDAATGVFVFMSNHGMHCSDKKTAALLRLIWG